MERGGGDLEEIHSEECSIKKIKMSSQRVKGRNDFDKKENRHTDPLKHTKKEKPKDLFRALNLFTVDICNGFYVYLFHSPYS